jgi:hypothetical protein
MMQLVAGSWCTSSCALCQSWTKQNFPFCWLQLPTFNELSMVSLLGAVMSVAHCVIVVVSGNVFIL